MARRNKLEEDYKNFNLQIERMKEDQISKIRSESESLKDKVSKIKEQ